MPVESHYISAT